MALKGLIKLFLLAAVVSLAYGGCKRNNGNVPCTKELEIVYNGKYPVICGESIPLNAVQNKPKITYKGAVTGLCFNMTIIFFDSNRPVVKPYLQWMVVNADPSDVFNGDLSKADEPFTYEGPAAIDDTYVYYLYCYAGYIDPSEVKRNFDRKKFNIAKFQRDYHLGTGMASKYHTLRLLRGRRNH